LIWLEKDWLVCIPCCDVVAFSRLSKYALAKVWGQVWQDREFAFDDALGFNMGGSEGAAVLE
jgi:hypothetical protein